MHWLTESRGRAPIVAWSWIRVVTFPLFVNASLAEWSYAITLCTIRDSQYLFAVGETDPCLLDLTDITADSRSLTLRLLRLLLLMLRRCCDCDSTLAAIAFVIVYHLIFKISHSHTYHSTTFPLYDLRCTEQTSSVPQSSRTNGKPPQHQHQRWCFKTVQHPRSAQEQQLHTKAARRSTIPDTAGIPQRRPT